LQTSQGKRQITAISGCQSDVEIVPGRRLNAHADGEIVQLSSAVVDEARNDDELSFLIAHELAHNILEHPQKLERGKRSTGRIRETEIEADRMALSLMKRAGFDHHAAARFWARFGAKTGYGIFSDGTHMRTKPRVAFLEQVAASLDRGGGRE
jgi:beta-barrel assembly-enhancing protease